MAATTTPATLAADTADAVAAQTVASVLGKKPAPAAAPGLKLTVDAADRKSLSRSQSAALNRAQSVLAGTFDVSVEYGGEGAEQSADDEKTEPVSGAAPV